VTEGRAAADDHKEADDPETAGLDRPWYYVGDPRNLQSVAPRELTTDHRLVVSLVHQKHAWIPPVSLELRHGVIEVEYNCEGLAIPPRTVTRDRLEYIRAALKPYHFDDYRVSCIGRPGFAENGVSTVSGDGPIEWEAKDDSAFTPKQSR
jgi:hypothetical protein